MPASWDADYLPLGGTSVRALYGSLAIAVKEGKGGEGERKRLIANL
jgi:hypothetical protein